MKTLSNKEIKKLCQVLAVAFTLLLIGSINVNAQCNCTFTIPSGSYQSFDGAAKGVKGGDVICVSAGSIPTVAFKNIVGSAGNPVIIKNCGGQVILGSATASHGMSFEKSRYVHVTGTGSSVTYGFKVIQTKPGSQGLSYANLSSDVEIDHMEIANAGFSGIMVKTDPTSDCSDQSACRPKWVLNNVSIHDNYIYKCVGEGIYLGNSFYKGTTQYCGTMEYPHEVRGVRIFNNKFESTGRESIQVGSAVSDVEVYNNSIYNYATLNEAQQNGGVQMGAGTTGKFYGNFIKGGTGPALAIQGIGNEVIYNNVFVNPGTQAITLSISPTPLSTDIVNKGYLGGVYIINNTFVNAIQGVVKEYLVAAPGNVMYNNLIIASASVWDLTYAFTDWQRTNNVVLPALADAQFVNAAADDYHLLAASPAVNVGRDVSAWGVTQDYDRKNRPYAAANDAGAFEYIPKAPTANAGIDKSIILPTNTLSLTGSATDADGTIAKYAWTKQSGPAATLTNSATATLSLSALVAGTYVFRITATDNAGYTGYDETTVIVKAPPVVDAGVDQIIAIPITTGTLAGTATDPVGTITSYSWSKQSGPTATLTNTTAPVLSLSNLVADGSYVFRLTVTNSSAVTSYDEATVTVKSSVATGTVLYRINCGGAATIAASPLNWASDTKDAKSPYLDAGSLNFSTGSLTWKGTNTTGAPDALFGPNRYSTSATYGTQMQWNFPLTSGNYEVRLYFAENPYTGGVYAKGERLFGVNMEGSAVLTNFDIYATGGMGAVKKVFQVTVTDGTLDIDFIRSIGNPQVNGIEIITAAASSSSSTTSSAKVASASSITETVVTDSTALSINGIGALEKEPTLEVYPNPFQSQLNIELNSDQKEITVSLLSMSGQPVFNGIVPASHSSLYTIDLSKINITPGMYVLTITTGKSKIYRKVLKE